MLMHIPPALIEFSFSDVVAKLELEAELPEVTRRHWLCSVRQIGKALDRPLELVPARWTAVRIPVDRLHHYPLGITAKTLANHRANVKAALRWFTGGTGGPLAAPPWAPTG